MPQPKPKFDPNADHSFLMGEGKTKLVQDGAVFLKDGTYERMLEQAAAPAPKTPPAPKKEPAKPKAEPPARPAAEDEDPLAD